MSTNENLRLNFVLSSYAEKKRRCDTPCDDPESSWFRTEHLFNIVTDSIDTVKPRNRDGFEENGDDNRIKSWEKNVRSKKKQRKSRVEKRTSIVLKQFDEINSAVSTAWNSDNKVKQKQNSNEPFAMSSKNRKFVAQRRYDSFAAAELEQHFRWEKFILERFTDESRPKVKSIKKKNIAQTGAHGIVAIASG